MEEYLRESILDPTAKMLEGFDGTEAGLDGTLVGCAACWFVLGAPRLGMLGMEHEHDEKNRLNKPTRIRRMQ